MKKAARVTDRFVGVCNACIGRPTVGGSIISGSPDTTINSLPSARVGDTGLGDCGHTTLIVGGSPDTFVNGKAQARVGDPVAGVIDGVITTGSPNCNVN